MTGDEEQLAIAVVAKLTELEKQMAKANGITARAYREMSLNSRKATRQMEQDAARSAARINQSLATVGTRLGAVGKAFNVNVIGRGLALIGGAQGFRVLSDGAAKIDNALKVAGLSGQELDRVYAKLRDSAQSNAAPLETLVQLYGRVALVQKELGISSDQLVSFSNNVALALRVSGQSSQEASGALLQLSQALGSGVVRAEEFNSILEGAPTILQAAAAGIKEAEGSVSKLRAIMLDGKLSSKALFDGFQAGVPVLEQKVAGAVLTLDQRLENLRTSLVDAARRFNSSSEAANTFGSAIDNASKFVNGVDFETLITEIRSVAAEFNAGANAAQQFAEWAGKASGLANIGDGIVGALGGKNGKAEFFGGALNIESTIRTEDKLGDLAEKRLSLEKQIAEVKRNPANVLAPAELRQLETQLDSVNKKASALAGNITGGDLVYDRFSPPKAQSGAFTPISITDPKYAADKSGKGKKGGGSRANEYQREVEQIQKRTSALQSEAQAQSGLNPLVNDYGFAVEYAAAKHDLLTAAQEAGVKVTPQLTASIDDLAAGYANAVVASEQLAEKQDEIRKRAEEAMSTAKSVTKGIIDGFMEGASAADILKDALKKIADTLLNDVLNSIFKVSNAAGGSGGGLLSSLFSGIFGGGTGGFQSLPVTGPVPATRPFAKGGAFANGISGFSNQVVNRPTTFAFAKGAGLMGEAGPEAIMPLKRDSSGRLGVSVNGSANTQSSSSGGTSEVVISLSPELVGQILSQAQGQAVKLVQKSNKNRSETFMNGGNPQ